MIFRNEYGHNRLGMQYPSLQIDSLPLLGWPPRHYYNKEMAQFEIEQ